MKTRKRFDAVQMMRLIRDRLSKRFRRMTFEEQKDYMRKQLGHKATEKATRGRQE